VNTHDPGAVNFMRNRLAALPEITCLFSVTEDRIPLIFMEKKTQKTTPVRSETEKGLRSVPADFSFFPFAYRNGMLAGGLMGAYVLLLELLGVGSGVNMVLPDLMYIIISVVVYRALRTYKFIAKEGQTFQRGMVLGSLISGTAGVVFAAISILAFFIGGENLAFERCNMEITNPLEAFAMALGYVLMIFVGGFIATFVSVQFFKDRSEPGE
jgi:hypothetical protein